MLLFDYAFHIFHHDNGVIDHNAYGKHQPKQSKHVDGESEHEHESECAYEGYGHSYKGYECGAPALERKEHY